MKTRRIMTALLLTAALFMFAGCGDGKTISLTKENVKDYLAINLKKETGWADYCTVNTYPIADVSFEGVHIKVKVSCPYTQYYFPKEVHTEELTIYLPSDGRFTDFHLFENYQSVKYILEEREIEIIDVSGSVIRK